MAIAGRSAAKAMSASLAASTGKMTRSAARETARREQSEVIIQGEDGQIRERNSYGNDPHPPKG
jgi:hypothetical protein